MDAEDYSYLHSNFNKLKIESVMVLELARNICLKNAFYTKDKYKG